MPKTNATNLVALALVSIAGAACSKSPAAPTDSGAIRLSSLQVVPQGFDRRLCGAFDLTTVVDELTIAFEATGTRDGKPMDLLGSQGAFLNVMPPGGGPISVCSTALCESPKVCVISGSTTGSGVIRTYLRQQWQPLTSYAVTVSIPGSGVPIDTLTTAVDRTGGIGRDESRILNFLISDQGDVIRMDLAIFRSGAPGRTLRATVDLFSGNGALLRRFEPSLGQRGWGVSLSSVPGLQPPPYRAVAVLEEFEGSALISRDQASTQYP